MPDLYLTNQQQAAEVLAQTLGRQARSGDVWQCRGGHGVLLLPRGSLFALRAAPWDLDPAAIIDWNGFGYDVRGGHLGVVERVKELLMESYRYDRVVIATETSRRGEAVARLLLKHIGWTGRVGRLWLTDMTDEGVRRGLSTIADGDENAGLYRAQLAVERADWLLGFALSRLFTQLLGADGQTFALGRVQTAALALIRHREEMIEHHRDWTFREPVLTVRATARKAMLPPLRHVPSVEHPLGGDEAQEILSRAPERPLRVRIDRRTEPRPPLPLPNLAALRAHACAQWGWDTDEVIGAARALHELGLITFPETEATTLPPERQNAAAGLIVLAARRGIAAADALIKAAGKKNKVDVVESDHVRQELVLRPGVYAGPGIDGQHAIVPTGREPIVENLDDRQTQLYQLVLRRFVAAHLPDHLVERVEASAEFGGRTYVAVGAIAGERGWFAAFDDTERPLASSDELPFPDIPDGTLCDVVHVRIHDRTVAPPKPYTAGTLIAAMGALSEDHYPRKDGLAKEFALDHGPLGHGRLVVGTEATRGSIIRSLLKHGYVAAGDDGALATTDKGRLLINALRAVNLDADLGPYITAVWQIELDGIASGRVDAQDFMGRIEAWLRALIARTLAHRDHLRAYQAISLAKSAGDLPIRLRVPFGKGAAVQALGARLAPDRRSWLVSARADLSPFVRAGFPPA